MKHKNLDSSTELIRYFDPFREIESSRLGDWCGLSWRLGGFSELSETMASVLS